MNVTRKGQVDKKLKRTGSRWLGTIRPDLASGVRLCDLYSPDI